jgi:hypothetical protein
MGQTLDSTTQINPFQAIIVNSNFSAAYSIWIMLTNSSLEVRYKSGLENGKDTILFSKKLLPSDTLRAISEININSLKQRYQNNCIEDGSQITIVLKKNGNTKAVHLSNYYQEDVGKIIYLTNALLPEKFKVWYNKEKLIEDLKNCKQKLKK